MGGRGPILAVACAIALCFAASANAGRPPVLQRRSFLWPASGTITRPFGYDDMGFHPGVDIGMLRSLDVRAAAPGVVADTGYATGFEGYGNIVLVDLGEGVQTLYAHLDATDVRRGEHVVPGQLLGIAGCTGFCTGTHLHFELRLDGTAINPLPYLPGGIPTAPAGLEQARSLLVASAARALLDHVPELRLGDLLAPSSERRPIAPPLLRLALGARRPFP